MGGASLLYNKINETFIWGPFHMKLTIDGPPDENGSTGDLKVLDLVL